MGRIIIADYPLAQPPIRKRPIASCHSVKLTWTAPPAAQEDLWAFIEKLCEGKSKKYLQTVLLGIRSPVTPTCQNPTITGNLFVHTHLLNDPPRPSTQQELFCYFHWLGLLQNTLHLPPHFLTIFHFTCAAWNSRLDWLAVHTPPRMPPCTLPRTLSHHQRPN